LEEEDDYEDFIPSARFGDMALPPADEEVDSGWKSSIYAPTNYYPRKEGDGPQSNLDLHWVHGYDGKNGRHNVRYIFSEQAPEFPDPCCAVYPAASLVVVYSRKMREQRFYQGHSVWVTALAIHPCGNLVASADQEGEIHLWDALTLTVKRTLKGLGRVGIQLLNVSPDGTTIAAVGKDPQHTLTLHSLTTGEIMSSAPGLSAPNNVMDLSFSLDGGELAIVGKVCIKFFYDLKISSTRALQSTVGKIGKQGKKQTFFCVEYLKGDNCLAGCGSGEIYRFVARQLVEVIQAHAPGEPVLTMRYRASIDRLVTGCKDGFVMMWRSEGTQNATSSLSQVGSPVDISEDLDGDGLADSGCLDAAIKSVDVAGNRILIGTKACDIFEAEVAATPADIRTLDRVCWGHGAGELWGLSVHPSREEFVTAGDDGTVRCWSLRSSRQVCMRKVPGPARAVGYSTSGNSICVGLGDGTMLILESYDRMRLKSRWKHSSEPIRDIKYSYDGHYIAAASDDGNVYIYWSEDKLSFKRQAVCKGHSGSVLHVDFSADSQTVQSSGLDGTLQYWTTRGVAIKDNLSMRDEKWGSPTCTFGWAVQGIWPAHTSAGSVNCCQAIPELRVIVAGDTDSNINLFKYPALHTNCVKQTYLGHSARVTNVRVSGNRRFVISEGGIDGCVLVWRQDLEECASDTESEPDHMGYIADVLSEEYCPDNSSASTKPAMDSHAMVPSAGDEHLPPSQEGGSGSLGTAPWLKAISAPTSVEMESDSPHESTDVDLKLEWVHGYRSMDCRNSLRFTASGLVVYTTAAIGVVYDKTRGKQYFLQGVHDDVIIGLAMHPTEQKVATGQMGKNPKICIWEPADGRDRQEEINALVTLQNCHEDGVPLLAFNDRGDLLATVGMGHGNKLVVHDWSKQLPMFSTPTFTGRVFCLCFLSSRLTGDADGEAMDSRKGKRDGETAKCVTGGANHLTFWWSVGKNVKSQKALWPINLRAEVKVVLSVASSTAGFCVTGSASGDLMVWREHELVSDTRKLMESTPLSHDLQEIAEPSGTGAKIREDKDTNMYTRMEFPHNAPITAIWCSKSETLPFFGEEEWEDLAHHCISKGGKGGGGTGGEGAKMLDNLKAAPLYVTGDSAGVLAVWSMVNGEPHGAAQSNGCNTTNVEEQCSPFLKFLFKLDLALEPSIQQPASLRSVCVQRDLLLVGTSSSEIFDLTLVPMEEALKQQWSPPSSASAQIPGTTLSSTVRPMSLAAADSAEALKSLQKKDGTVDEPTPADTTAGEHAATIAVLDPGTQETTQFNATFASAQASGDILPKVTPFSFESVPDGVNILHNAHSSGELWGLAAHHHEAIFLTVGDDATLFCWDMAADEHSHSQRHQCVAYMSLSEKSRAVAIRPSNIKGARDASTTVPAADEARQRGKDEIAIGLNNGQIWIVWMEDFMNKLRARETSFSSKITGQSPMSAAVPVPEDKLVLQPASRWIKDLQYSFTGSILAAGSHDSLIYVYMCDESGQGDERRRYNLLARVQGHQSAVSRIDFGVFVHIPITSKTDHSVHQWEYDPDSGEHREYVLSTDADGTTKREIFETQMARVGQPSTLGTSGVPSFKDLCLQSSGVDGELLFWRFFDSEDAPSESGTTSPPPSTPHAAGAAGAVSVSQRKSTGVAIHQVTAVSSMRDCWWATNRCEFGWAVQGIWNPTNPVRVNVAARSHSYRDVPVIASGDEHGNLKIYDYPCTREGSPDKCYHGHSRHITNLAFSHNDTLLISTGGSDQSIFVWRTDIKDEIQALKAHGPGRRSNIATGHPVPSSEADETFEVSTEKARAPRSGDESMAVKPYMGAIRVPSGWVDQPGMGEPPENSLQLKWAYGYRGWDTRNNIGFADNGQIVYHVAGLGIAFNVDQHKQTHNTEHGDDILCLSVHPKGHTVATGEIGPKPKIVLWDANTGVTIRIIKYHTKGVSHIVFSSSGEELVSIGMDEDRTVAVHSVSTGQKLGNGKAGRGVSIYSLAAGSLGFVTAGKRFIKFWDLPRPGMAGEINCKKGITGKMEGSTNFVSATYIGRDTVTGMSDGAVVLWKNRTLSKRVRPGMESDDLSLVDSAHRAAVTSICVMGDDDDNPGVGSSADGARKVLTGGGDGLIFMWSIQLKKLWALDLANTSVPENVSGNSYGNSLIPSISALAVKGSKLVLGTKASELYLVDRQTGQATRVMEGHFSPRGELWALAASPILGDATFVTCGDDMTCRVWNGRQRAPLQAVNIGAKVRAVAVSPDAMQVALATLQGTLLVLDRADLKIQKASVHVCKEWIQAITYSPDGALLAIGSHGGAIYVLDTRTYMNRAIAKGHHGAIIAVDFSKDSKYMRSTSNDYELLFWEASGKQVKSASAMRDVEWATCTCLFGWPVQGIYPEFADGTDVNSVDRSPDGSLLVTGDDVGTVKLFRYPALEKHSECKSYKGHSAHVMQVRFSKDGKFVYSVGGIDKAILQYEVKKVK
jgi:microtubule-associated protein-like 6